MEERKCKNKKCDRVLPEGYKYKYCEHCRNKQSQQLKNIGKATLGVVGVVVSIATRNRFGSKK